MRLIATSMLVILVAGILSLPFVKWPAGFRFQASEESQHVVFLTERWPGGNSFVYTSSVVPGKPLEYKGLRLCLREEAYDRIQRHIEPVGNMEDWRKNWEKKWILVEAKVHLQPATKRTPEGLETSFYEVVIDALIRAEYY